MNVQGVLIQFLMVLMIVLTGALLRRRRVMSDPVIKGINQIILQAALPAMIIMTTQQDFDLETKRGFFGVLGMALVLLYAASALVFILARRLPHDRRSVFTALSCLPNAGYIGTPIVRAAYGEVGVLYLAGYIMAFNLVIFTLHMVLFSGDGRLQPRALLNLGMIASLAALLLLVFEVRLPEPFRSFGLQLGSLTTPLSTLMLGARVEESLSLRKLKSGLLWLSVGVRLVVFPALVFAALRLMGLGGMALGVMVICSALPAAAATQMLSERFDADVQLAAQGISLSLLLCVLTVPTLMAAFGF